VSVGHRFVRGDHADQQFSQKAVRFEFIAIPPTLTNERKTLGWQGLRKLEVHSGVEVLLAQAASLQGAGEESPQCLIECESFRFVLLRDELRQMIEANAAIQPEAPSVDQVVKADELFQKAGKGGPVRRLLSPPLFGSTRPEHEPWRSIDGAA
jgi:hypothetical protein